LRDALLVQILNNKVHSRGIGILDMNEAQKIARVRLVVVGADSNALPVVDLAVNLGWHTTVVDTRGRASSLERFRKADAVVLCRPEDVMSQASVFERAMVVVMMTHNDPHDLEILRQLLPMRLRYLKSPIEFAA
jgi:xanthine/CO dehydrogenase XdhC/CoxF family maturation factor